MLHFPALVSEAQVKKGPSLTSFPLKIRIIYIFSKYSAVLFSDDSLTFSAGGWMNKFEYAWKTWRVKQKQNNLNEILLMDVRMMRHRKIAFSHFGRTHKTIFKSGRRKQTHSAPCRALKLCRLRQVCHHWLMEGCQTQMQGVPKYETWTNFLIEKNTFLWTQQALVELKK